MTFDLKCWSAKCGRGEVSKPVLYIVLSPSGTYVLNLGLGFMKAIPFSWVRVKVNKNENSDQRCEHIQAPGLREAVTFRLIV